MSSSGSLALEPTLRQAAGRGSTGTFGRAGSSTLRDSADTGVRDGSRRLFVDQKLHLGISDPVFVFVSSSCNAASQSIAACIN